MCFYLGFVTDGENICLDRITYKIYMKNVSDILLTIFSFSLQDKEK